MDNLLCYEPLWADGASTAFRFPQKDIHDLILKCMKQLKLDSPTEAIASSIGDIISTVLEFLDTLLRNQSDENFILQRARAAANTVSMPPEIAIRSAIVAWYLSSYTTLHRPRPDTPQPLLDQSNAAVAQREGAIDTSIANLGYLAMLTLKEMWVPPSDNKLRVASLISNGTVTFLVVGILIIPHLGNEVNWPDELSKFGPLAPFETLLKTSWAVAREKVPGFVPPPGIEFGATNAEVKLNKTGHTLMTSVGEGGEWFEVPYWHPCRVVPGSAWNRFIRNTHQHIFPTKPRDELTSEVYYRVPSSACSLVDRVREYYQELRTHFDQEDIDRYPPVSEEAKAELFVRLAEATGLMYPINRPWEEETNDVEELADLGYMYELPFRKKPASDMNGYLTLPFLNSLVHSFRMGVEPVPTEMGLVAFGFNG
ncbi:hypothetical protein B0T10DRAFT_448785 [Thelonectria olida]|uniref:Uncharacterized protein n=1 Tax=Thelonectria olida TaxID=1576542 RepID=A0A9P8VTM3_9HYPO|nr:hypothetical protein B0T10DRAFT_448785 [Thelonectria olida]